jgi:hypothetical protein
VRLAPILKSSLFGALIGIPIAVVWFQWARGMGLTSSLMLGLALGPSGASAAAISHHLVHLAPHAPRARILSYVLSAFAGVAMAYPAFWVLVAALGKPWMALGTEELLPAAGAGLLSSYYTQTSELKRLPSGANLPQDSQQ